MGNRILTAMHRLGFEPPSRDELSWLVRVFSSWAELSDENLTANLYAFDYERSK
jgi:hypothetical protein